MGIMRVSFEEMKNAIALAFTRAGLSAETAELCAKVHTESSRDGVYSHGLNRVPRFVSKVRKGWVKPEFRIEKADSFGCMETYDGFFGPGIANAAFAIDRATELAATHGIGLVGLKNTTHWMRGGTYSWQAIDKGYMSICWTNSEPCMPAWGALSPTVGNNPLCIGIPGTKTPFVLDMAMSLYSYGALESAQLAGKELEWPGGYDAEGRLTRDPRAIMETQRVLPAGLWKGSGLAVALDLSAAILSGGLSTCEVGRREAGNSGCSQVFIAINPRLFSSQERIDALIEDTRTELSRAPLAEGFERIYLPGERTIETRRENEALGIPVDSGKWEKVRALAES